MCISFSSYSLAIDNNNNISITIDGVEVVYTEDTGYPFIDDDNHLQMPFIATLEAYGANVYWSEEIKVISATKNYIYVSTYINSKGVKKNGEFIDENASAIYKDGKVYLPLRLIMEAFGCDVLWNDDTKTVSIITHDSEYKHPEVKVEAPEIVDGDSVKIKFITDDENVIYLNNKIIQLDNNKEYEVKLPKQENYFSICVKGKNDLVTYKSLVINRDSSKIYLNLKYDKKVDRNRVMIWGETQKDNKVTINDKKIRVSKKGEFDYSYSKLKEGKNLLTLVAKNEDTGEIIEKEIEIYFDKPDDYESENEEDALLDIQETVNDTADEDADPPVINLDNEIPEITNEKTITISGTCEDANFICILGGNGKSPSVKIKLDDSNKFSHTIALCTNDDDHFQQTEKGIRSFIQIWAANKDKVTVKEYFIYYKEED